MFVREFIVSSVALCCSGSSRIARIEVPDDDLLSATSGSLAHEVVVAAIGRSNEGGRDTDDALQSLIDTAHLGSDLCQRELREVLVGPGVRCDHVSLTVGILDPLDTFWGVYATI